MFFSQKNIFLTIMDKTLLFVNSFSEVGRIDLSDTILMFCLLIEKGNFQECYNLAKDRELEEQEMLIRLFLVLLFLFIRGIDNIS